MDEGIDRASSPPTHTITPHLVVRVAWRDLRSAAHRHRRRRRPMGTRYRGWSQGAPATAGHVLGRPPWAGHLPVRAPLGDLAAPARRAVGGGHPGGSGDVRRPGGLTTPGHHEL